MESWRKKLVVADRSSDWLLQLISELESRHLPKGSIWLTSHGVDVQKCLTDADGPPAVVVVGSQLEGLGGLEALFLAAQAETKFVSGKGPCICLLSETRSDIEFFELMRARKVHVFLFRDDPLEITAERLLAAFFGELRRQPRFAVKIKAEIDLGGSTVAARIENISLGGCLVSFPAGRRAASLSVGTGVGLSFAYDKHKLKSVVEIRQITRRKGSLWRKELLLGVSFSSDFDTAKTLQDIIHQVELAREGPLPFTLPTNNPWEPPRRF